MRGGPYDLAGHGALDVRSSNGVAAVTECFAMVML
jgi:hypothetical protein